MPLRPRTSRTLAGLAAGSLAVAGLPLLTATAGAAAPSEPFVSELHYDNAVTDVGEFVEVQLPPGTSSAGLSLVFYNGNGGKVYGTVAVPEREADDEATVVAVDTPGLQNGGPDGLALVRGSDEVLDLLSYEGSFSATDGPAAGSTTTDIGVEESGSTPVGHSLARVADTTTGDLVWTGPAPASRGEMNGGATDPEPEPDPDVCAAATTHEVGDVQGTGDASPLAGSDVLLRGTVVGDLEGLDGFSLQDVNGDRDDATSDGVFVFRRDAPVDLGDVVTVRGRVSERFGQTQVSATDVAVCEEGDVEDLPAAAPLATPSDDAERERLEGMLVDPGSDLVVSEVFALTRFGELLLSADGVLVQPTEVARPGTPEAAAVAAENERRSLVLDDGRDDPLKVDEAPYLTPELPVRVGDPVTLTSPVVLGYGFGAWRLQPADGTAEGTLEPANTRTAAPDPVGGDVTVAAFNVLNYFVTFEGLGRGAGTAEELERQAGKIVPAIRALDADVVALMEIEDTDSTGYSPGDADRALADLVERLNAAEGADVWAFVPLPAELYAVPRDVIRNGIVYRTDVVQPVGEPVGLVDESVWFNAREPIAQTFTKDGDAFTVVANHFKSKGGDATGDNAEAEQGAYNGDRTRQARSLAAFAADLAAATGDDDVLLLGDLNAYTQEDPVEVLRDAGFTDLGETLDPGRYSYVFDGRSGSLDHALASSALTPKVTDLSHWSINAVESFAYQYAGDPALYDADPYRSSDHDPLVLGIDLDERCDGRVPTLRGTEGDDVLVAGNGVDVVMGLGGDDRLVGGNGADVLCGGAGDDVLVGGNGSDALLGGFGADRLDGGNGADRLVGGPGDDALQQGRGGGTSEQEGPAS